MRVVCHSVDDFIENLKDRSIFEKVVWIDRTEQKINEQKFLINLQASAVIQTEEGGEILLQYGEDCGFDLLDGEAVLRGTEQMEKKRKFLEAYCLSAGLCVKPGIVDM